MDSKLSKSHFTSSYINSKQEDTDHVAQDNIAEMYQKNKDNIADSPSSNSTLTNIDGFSSKRKRRGTIQKRVVQIPIKETEGCRLKGESYTPPSDSWAWRKYGQKEIMGSPYPREYYRCSNRYSKGCLATKQVQRSCVDPTMLVVTYYSEHNHPWPLSGNQSRPTKKPEQEHEPEPVSDPVEPKEKFADLAGVESMITTADESGWLGEMETTLSTLKNETDGTLKEKNNVSYKQLSSLMRIRDFISLLMTYPMKLEEEGLLKSWICAFSEWKAQLLSTDDDSVIDKPWRVLTEKALRRMEGLMPMEIINQIELGERSIFNHIDATPEAILHLTVDLAVEQLIQTLFSRDHSVCYVRLLTRNWVEKRSVVNKIQAALEEKHNMFGIDKDFLRALWINASTYETDAEVQVQEEINTMMAGNFFVTEDNDMCTPYIEEKMASNRHLVIVVDADSNKKLDLSKVHFPTGIVVLVTTELSTQGEKDDDDFRITCIMDLNIRTQDHLLPWEIFCRYVGYYMVHSSMGIQRIAVQIVKECHGHLFAIILVAKYMENVKDVKQWELALDKLSNPKPSYDYQDRDRIGISRVMVNAFINIIWEDIDDIQKFYLELSLFVHKVKIGVPDWNLISDWNDTFFENSQETALQFNPFLEFPIYKRQARHNLRELLDRFVLLECGFGGDVYLPVETYDIIKTLHTFNPSIIRHGALELTEPPYIGRWHGLIRIELMDNKICELPQSPDCPKLKVLLLQGNADLLDIPDSFFEHMPLLQHLDLSYTSIRDLPPSISKLIQLKRFYLRGCDLFMELPPQIGQLKNLRKLDLDGTLITHMPKEIRALINLQSLTLCFDGYCHVLGHGEKGKQIIPLGVISSLTELNYLSINVDPEDERWNENVHSVLVEIFGLKKLKTVSIYVPKAELLELIPAQKSFNFRLVVGHHLRRFISRVTSKVEQEFKRSDNSLKFVNGVDVPNGVKMNLEHFKALYLDRHMTIKSLSDFELKNLHMLQICILAECNAMETIVDATHSHNGRALAGLKSLLVFYMKNLRSICEGPNPSFLFLKSIALHTCPMITTIFTLETHNNFPFLEEIIVEDCPKVTTLMSHNSPEQKPVFFLPNLKMISLLYLPELVNICNGMHVGPVLEKMVFYYCPKLQSLSKSELSSKSLKIIKGESMWWEALEWNAAEWGDAGRPKLFEQIFSPINEDADMMNQLAAHGETQINTDEDEFQRKRKISVPLEELRPPALRVGKESRTFGKPVKATQPVIIDSSNMSDFRNIVQSLTGQSSSVRTIFSENEMAQSGVDDITDMLEVSSTFRKEDDMEEMIMD